jgi:hypothetical protein
MNLHDEIATVAQELFEAKGRVCGHALDDWLNAEEIVLARHAGQELEEPEGDVSRKSPVVKPFTDESGEPLNEEMT